MKGNQRAGGKKRRVFVCMCLLWSACFDFLKFFEFNFFDVDHFKVFTEFVTILLLFYVLSFWPQGMGRS